MFADAGFWGLGRLGLFGVLAGIWEAFVGFLHDSRIAGGGKGWRRKLLMGLGNSRGDRRGRVQEKCGELEFRRSI